MASAPPNPTARLSRESGFLQCGAPHPASGARRHQGPARPRIARVCRRQTNKRRRAPTPRARRPAASQGSGRSFWPDRHRTPATSRPRAFMSTVPTFRDLRRSIGAAHVGLHTPVDWCWPQRVAPPALRRGGQASRAALGGNITRYGWCAAIPAATSPCPLTRHSSGGCYGTPTARRLRRGRAARGGPVGFPLAGRRVRGSRRSLGPLGPMSFRYGRGQHCHDDDASA